MTTILRQYGLRDVGKREVGIEIEVEGARLPTVEVPASWRAMGDGSLRGEGLEYVLTSPVLRKDVPQVLEDLMEVFRLNKSKINDSDNCGVHIHINCQQMETNDVLKFACLYLLMEEILVSLCGQNRAGNLFCLRAKDAEGLVFKLCEAKRSMNLNGLQSDEVRYSSMNMASLSKFGTIEFRAMRTPQDFRNLTQWVNILLTVKDASQMFNEIRDMVESVSREGAQRFLEMVFGVKEAYAMLVPDAEDMLMRGVRLVQEIAYTPSVRVERNEAEDLDPEWHARPGIVLRPGMYARHEVHIGPDGDQVAMPVDDAAHREMRAIQAREMERLMRDIARVNPDEIVNEEFLEMEDDDEEEDEEW